MNHIDHTAGDWWDRAARSAPALREVERLLLALRTAHVGGPWQEASDALYALQRLHGLGRPVCAGDEPSEMTITVRLDPMAVPKETDR